MAMTITVTIADTPTVASGIAIFHCCYFGNDYNCTTAFSVAGVTIATTAADVVFLMLVFDFSRLVQLYSQVRCVGGCRER